MKRTRRKGSRKIQNKDAENESKKKCMDMN